MHHALGPVEQQGDIEPHDRRGHDAEVRQRRESTADGGYSGKHLAKAVLLGDELQLRARIGDRDKVLAGFPLTDDFLDPLEEVLLEDVRLEGVARLAGHDEEGGARICFPCVAADLCRIGRIEDMQLRITGHAAKGLPQHLRAQTRSSHSQQQHMLVTGPLGSLGDPAQLLQVCDPVLGDAEPVQPATLVHAGPQRGIARPQPVHLVALSPRLEGLLQAGRQRHRQLPRLALDFRPCPGVPPAIGCAQQLGKGVLELQQALGEQLVGHLLE